MRLSDVWAVLDFGQGVTADGRTRSVNHVQQMRDSRCFVASEARWDVRPAMTRIASPHLKYATILSRAMHQLSSSGRLCGTRTSSRSGAGPLHDVPHAQAGL
ncbi:MAG: hypothetical protein R3C53_27420 [Pirellulaceae bacterium]